MKIFIVSDAWHPQINGVVRTYEYLCAELEKMGHEVKVAGPADFPLSMPMPGYKEIRLVIGGAGRLARMIEDFAPDHLHIATEGPLGWAARGIGLRKKMDFTTSYHTHFPDYFAKRVKKYIPALGPLARKFGIWHVRRFHSAARAIMVATPSLREDLLAWNFRVPMFPLTRGVDTSVFHPGDKTLFNDLKRPVALYVGRVAIEKSIHKFMEMDWPGSKVIVGDGPSREWLEKNYTGAVFAGIQTGHALADHYRSADVFAFPSKTDTFGIVLIEALACGLPVAGYPVTGPRDILTEPYLGAMDPDLATAAKAALNVGTAQQRFDHVRENYSWEEAARQFMDAATLPADAAIPAVPVRAA